MLTLFTVSVFLMMVIPVIVEAQFAQPGNSLSLHLSPTMPGPGEQVSASISGFSINLNRATITWFVGGRQVISGVGETSISFTAPPLGESTTVRVVINSNALGVVERVSTITPSEIDMLWEATDAYTPPFYRGKSLPSSQGIIRITAVPHTGVNESDERMVYKWKRNFRYRDFNDLSGYGARTITYQKNILEDTDRITAEVSSLNDDGVGGVSTVIIPAFTPAVLFYKNHPLYGAQYNRAFSNQFYLTAQESTIVIEPYFFSVENPGELSYVWKMEGEEVPNEDEERVNELTLRTEGDSGNTSFSLSVTHPERILQLLNTSLNVVFGEEAAETQESPFSL